MAKQTNLPPGCWPAVLPDDQAAAYTGEKTVTSFLSRVGTIWPNPWKDVGKGKGRYRVWRKADLDKAIGESETADQEAW